ncbi:MAG: BMC domain-containing protein [Lachnospiraceae bacterium]|nr:BMC domain-containing protein [Lachnospiraceae bacterium]MCR5410914.1 BMC domain-containing protein [Lachnospiraceae bacterium]
MNAYGFIEITGVVAAIDALDIMCKSANVTLSTWERKLGGRLVTLVIEGDVSAVRQAIEAGSTLAIKKPVASGVLANPHPEIRRIVELSASRFKGKDTPGIPDGHKMLGQDPPDFNLKEQLK